MHSIETEFRPVRRPRCARPGALAGTLAVALAVALAAVAMPASAGEVSVAVAANFTEPAQAIAKAFHAQTGHKVLLSAGSTGQLYAQITQEAPFEVFLAADRQGPANAVAKGLAVADSRFTYAIGRLVLFSTRPDLVTGEATLRAADFAKIALANPLTAPYGAAAVETLRALGVHDRLQARFVEGANIAQTWQFVATGNAELGFVALSQVVHRTDGSRWLVPETLHAPIAQDAVLLRRGEHSAAARGFLAFLKGAEAVAIIRDYGYRAPAGHDAP